MWSTKDTRKSQSSNVDGRCDGDEMSARDQRGRTSPSDRVKEDVSQEYFTLSKQTYTSENLREANELGGLAEILLQEEIENVK